MYKYTCALLGNPGTGKTSFIKRLKTGEFVKNYAPTRKLKVYKLDFSTTKGIVHFFVWDTTSVDDLQFLTLNCAIIFVDPRTDLLHNDINKFQKEMWSRECFVPIVVCHNKLDLTNIPLRKPHDFYLNTDDLLLFNISVKKTYNCEMPFLWFCRKFLCDSTLRFNIQIAKDPPYVPVDLTYCINHILEGISLPLPDDDDDW